MGNLYVVRHGQTRSNAEGVIQGPRLDSGLSELGQQQAAALAEAFAETPLDALYVSPMQRARDTAHALVQHQDDVAPQVVPEMYELDYGALCGQRLLDVEAEMGQVFDAWRLGFLDQRFPGGESANVAHGRVRAMAATLLARAQHEDVAVVAHGRINRILLAALTGAPLSDQDRFPQDNACISHVEVASGLVVHRLNDTSHLGRHRS